MKPPGLWSLVMASGSRHSVTWDGKELHGSGCYTSICQSLPMPQSSEHRLSSRDTSHPQLESRLCWPWPHRRNRNLHCHGPNAHGQLCFHPVWPLHPFLILPFLHLICAALVTWVGSLETVWSIHTYWKHICPNMNEPLHFLKFLKHAIFLIRKIHVSEMLPNDCCWWQRKYLEIITEFMQRGGSSWTLDPSSQFMQTSWKTKK